MPPPRERGGSTARRLWRVLTYSGDTQYHLDYRTLAARRHALDCRRIILTHMSPDMPARRAEVDLECADDGMLVEV